MNTKNDSIKLEDEIIDLYPLRTEFENILKLGYALGKAEYSDVEHSKIIPVDAEGLNRLQSIHDEILRQSTSGIEAISNVLAFIDHEELGNHTTTNLAILISGLASMQSALFDAGVTLEATSTHLAKKDQEQKGDKS